MNARDILEYGHRDVLQAFEGLTPDEWTRVGVTTRWTPKDLIAHLASFELFLEDALKSVLGETPTPTLEAMGRDHAGFNDREVETRRAHAADRSLREYTEAHERVMALIDRLGPARLAETGTIPWYGDHYALDDLIVYANYAHKREHLAQLRMFLSRVRGERAPAG